MAITLQMAQINARSDIDHAVIDNLRRNSWIFDQVTFDDAVTPGAGGGTLTYGHTPEGAWEVCAVLKCDT